jgi:hypothetical protein
VALELALKNKGDVDGTPALNWHLQNERMIKDYEKDR